MTLAHPAAVLPLRRLGLPMAALVAGSMVPDVPLFLGSQRVYHHTHSVVGVLGVDVLLTVLAVAGWVFVARDALVDMAPAAVRDRLPATAPLSARTWLLVPVAGIVGAATHVVWDSFTHPGRVGVRHLPFLQHEYLGVAGNRWAQYSSGILGTAIVALAALVWLRSRPRTPTRGPRVLGRWPLPAIAVAAVVTAVGTTWRTIPTGGGLYRLAFNLVVDPLLAVVLSGAVVCLIWQVARRVRRTTSGPVQPDQLSSHSGT